MPNSSVASPARIAWSLAALLVVSVALLVRVSLGKQSAEREWNDLYELAWNAHAGMYVPVYEGRTTEGDPVRLGEAESGERQVLLFFTTSCPYCEASVPTWKALGEHVAGREDARIVGVAIDSLPAARRYEHDHALTYPVVTMNSPRFARLFRVSGVPLTMIVDPDGRVTYARRGEFGEAVLIDSVRAVLDRAPREATPVPVTVPSIGPAEPEG